MVIGGNNMISWMQLEIGSAVIYTDKQADC